MNVIRKVIVVFKTHFDIGFTGLASEVTADYGGKMLPAAVLACRSTDRRSEGKTFVWTMPSWPLRVSMDSGSADASTVEAAEDLIRAGQIRWHALPFTTHTEFCGTEEFIRGMYVGRSLSERFGFWAAAAKMTDVPGHTRMLPSLLRGAGVRFLHLGCNPFSTPPEVPLLFNWEGPDGRRVITFYNKGEYGSAVSPPDDWPFPVWLALMSTSDNEGPHSPEAIDRILRELEQAAPEAEVRIGTLDDFAEAVAPYADSLPVVRSELSDTWIHGVGSYPPEVSRIRALRHELADAEKVLSVLLEQGRVSEAECERERRRIASAYELCLLFGEHTWGLDVKQMGESRHYAKESFMEQKATPIYQRMERSWEEKRDRVRQAGVLTDQLSSFVYGRLAESVAAEGPRFVVFNGTASERSGWVRLDGPKELRRNGWIPLGSGEAPVPLREEDGVLYAYVRDVPAVGYVTLVPSEKRSEGPAKEPSRSLLLNEKDYSMENRWYKVQVDPVTGSISSLIEKSTGHEWVNVSESGAGIGRYTYDVYGDQDITEFLRTYAYRFYTWGIIDFGRAGYPVQPHLEFAPADFRVSAKEEPGRLTLTLASEIIGESPDRYGNARGIELHVTLHEDAPWIDLCLKLSGKEESPFVEAGHLAFPLNLPGHRVFVQKLGYVVDSAKDIARCANHTLHCADRWVDVSDGERGLAVIPTDTPLFSVGEKGILRFQREARDSEPTIAFNLFNNSWGTNFPQWMGGDYTFRFRLVAHAGDWREADIPMLSLDAFSPLRSVYSEEAGEAGMPARYSLFDLPEGVEVLCWKPAEDGEGFILRLQEQLGRAGDFLVKVKGRKASFEVCDLLETGIGLAVEHKNECRLPTRPFEVHTLRIRFMDKI